MLATGSLRDGDHWGPPTPTDRGERWPTRVDEQYAAGVRPEDVEQWAHTASLLHSNGDAIEVAVKDERIVGVRGVARDRVNRGRLCVTDRFGWQANGSPDRLTSPAVGGEPATWDDALALVTARIKDAIRRYGRNSIGFYSSGQLYLEEYWTLATIARAGIKTPHLDGNTRLCTATAGESLKESFGSDGQPGSYEDVEHCDALALWGHNVAETQPVLWERMRDRLLGGEPPRLLVVDPRETEPARHAELHLAVRPGGNLPLLLALQHELIRHGWIDEGYIGRATVGFEALQRAVADWDPRHAASLTGLDSVEIEAAAELVGTSEALTSTVLQGVYQANQATASACQINNIHLLRGMLGRPGCAVMQMNGQPTAQNTRETGANGDLPGFRNWANPRHVQELREIWNVDDIPHDGPPTHAMKIFELAEQGEIRVLWISATNPAVSLPQLGRIREILRREDVFVVAQDIFPNETTALADVVLPAATWGEKTGVQTNADRTVHLNERAVAPPGQARPDFEIFCELARRLDLRDRDGRSLVWWSTPEEAYAAWQRASAGRPCDYTDISYDRLREQGGVQWGGERLYCDGVFPGAQPDMCETYGKDLNTGESLGAEWYRQFNPEGRAMLRVATYQPEPEAPDDERPLRLVSGRSIFHFHTRTKTGRAPELVDAAPDVWVEIDRTDARVRDITEGVLVEVANKRGAIHARTRIVDGKPGTIFMPFHYGSWDQPDEPSRAANELTATRMDPVSSQPAFKDATVHVSKV
jgi:ferredoxin-nitrate reductase